MSHDRVRIRRATLEDVPRMAAIIREENPAWVFSERGMQHRWESAPKRVQLLELVATAGNEVVGRGGAGLTANTSVEGASGLGVTVVGSERGKGIGSRLYEALLEHLTSIGARSMFVHFARNDAGERFARARGFVHSKSAPISRVDPRTVELDLPEDADFRLLPFSAVRDRPRDLFELDAVASLDEPSVNPIDAMRYEEWLRSDWENPDLDFDGSTVVLNQGSLVAFTWLQVDAERGRAVSAFTGTLPEFRGRGLATRAKLRTLRWAAEHGITSVTTSNDDSNVAMLTVNRRVGFRPIGTLVTYQRDL